MTEVKAPERINLYKNPPQNTLSLDNLEQLCLKRLLILKKCEFLTDSSETENQIMELTLKFARESDMFPNSIDNGSM